MADQKKPQRRDRKPADGTKRKFLATLDPEVIKDLKLAAIKDEKSASECLEEAAREWLESACSRAWTRAAWPWSRSSARSRRSG